jgi:hypothetical protein
MAAALSQDLREWVIAAVEAGETGETGGKGTGGR